MSVFFFIYMSFCTFFFLFLFSKHESKNEELRMGVTGYALCGANAKSWKQTNKTKEFRLSDDVAAAAAIDTAAADTDTPALNCNLIPRRIFY